MNRESCGYWVRALNKLASLSAQFSFDDVDRPVGAKGPSRIEGRRTKSSKVAQRGRSRFRNRREQSKIDRVNDAA